MSAFRAAVALALLVACQFDERGLPNLGLESDSGPSLDTPSPSPPDAAVPDAFRPDAAIPCVDEDGDSYEVPASLGGTCAGPVDCDDTDPRAHPGQADFFDVPRASGGYDYDCDGVETPLDARQGEDCHWDWFSCEGTGWLGAVPACGQEGTYHWCQPDWEHCEEASVQTGRMPCR